MLLYEKTIADPNLIKIVIYMYKNIKKACLANIAKDIIQLHVSKVSDPIWENVCIHFTFEDLKDGQTRKIMVKRQQWFLLKIKR